MSNSKLSSFKLKNLFAITGLLLVSVAQASPREQAKRLHERLAGVPPSDSVLDRMEDKISRGRLDEAAYIAIDNPNFIRVTVKNWIAPSTNADQRIDLALNDYSATVIGMIRDDVRFDKVLYGDILYKASPNYEKAFPTTANTTSDPATTTTVSGTTTTVQGPTTTTVNPGGSITTSTTTAVTKPNALGVPTTTNSIVVVTRDASGTIIPNPIVRPFAMNSNNHYADIEAFLDVADPKALVQTTQTAAYNQFYANQAIALTGPSNITNKVTDVAGILTTRQAASEFFSAGTNRRMWRFTIINYLCKDMEQLYDTTRPDFRVRRDVDRKPGGDSRIYKNKCMGCHAVQDPFAGAFAYTDFAGTMITQTANNTVVAKYNDPIRITTPDGFTTIDNSWVNLITTGQNASLGWRQPTEGGAEMMGGKGINSLGRVLAKTEAFSSCMAERVFKKVCLRDPEADELPVLKAAATKFEEGDRYNMKELFARVGTMCIGN